MHYKHNTHQLKIDTAKGILAAINIPDVDQRIIFLCLNLARELEEIFFQN